MTLTCWFFPSSPTLSESPARWWRFCPRGRQLYSPGQDTDRSQGQRLPLTSGGMCQKYTWHRLQKHQVWQHRDRQFPWQVQSTEVSEDKLDRARGAEGGKGTGIRFCLQFWRKTTRNQEGNVRAATRPLTKTFEMPGCFISKTPPGKGPRGSCISAYENHATCAPKLSSIFSEHRARRYSNKRVSNEWLDGQHHIALPKNLKRRWRWDTAHMCWDLCVPVSPSKWFSL